MLLEKALESKGHTRSNDEDNDDNYSEIWITKMNIYFKLNTIRNILIFDFQNNYFDCEFCIYHGFVSETCVNDRIT